MTITVESVVSSARERGLVPVRLQDDPAGDDGRFWPFDGSLDEFLDVVKAMGSKAVYFVPYTFEGDFFEFFSDEEEDEDDLDEEEDDDSRDDEVDDATERLAIDLVEVEPRLSAFKARLGEQHYIKLLALTAEAHLQLELFAPWYDEASALREPAVERLRASADERAMAQEVADEKRRETKRTELAEQLHRLPTDPAFRDLRTKAAMTAYVMKEFPDAKTVLSGAEFREKLTELHNRAHLERARR